MSEGRWVTEGLTGDRSDRGTDTGTDLVDVQTGGGRDDGTCRGTNTDGDTRRYVLVGHRRDWRVADHSHEVQAPGRYDS